MKPLASENNSSTLRAAKIYGDYLAMLIVPCVLSIWFYGTAAVRTLCAGLITAVVCDFTASYIVKRRYFAADLSGICAGIMTSLMLPADVPVYIPVIASAFAVIVVKIPFGGGMRVPFSPAAAGFAFTAICFRDTVFSYNSGRAFMTTVSLGSTLMNGGTVRLNAPSFLDILTGNIYGPMGTGCMIAFIACIIFLFIRRRYALPATAGFLISCIILSLIFPRSAGSLLSSPVLELSSGSLMFASVFLITEPSTLPPRMVNRVLYGVCCGVLCMVMRHTGAFEEPVCFAVLLANAAAPLLELGTDRIAIILSSKSSSAKEATENE